MAEAKHVSNFASLISSEGRNPPSELDSGADGPPSATGDHNIMGNFCSSESEYPSKSGAREPVCLSAEDVEDLKPESFGDREKGRLTWKTLISSDKTPSNSMTAGLATCPPAREHGPPSAGGNLALHRHIHAEIYIIQSGEGIVNIDLIEHKVSAGSVVFIPSNAEHGVRNTSTTENLVWYYCFAADSFQDIRYRFKNEQMKYAYDGH